VSSPTLETPVAPSTPPAVTVVIPMRNEGAGIAACLASVLANRLPDGSTLEVLVVDGASSDDSAAIVRTIAASDPRVRLLDNPDRLQAAAFNRALAEARGRYFVRMDAHSTCAPDYVAECVRLLESTGAGNVGGVQRAEGNTWTTRAIAAAVSSRFGAGDARYRNANTPSFTDTVYLGAWRTETLRRLGGMREDWAVNEDYELNIRLRAAGETVYLSPTIGSTYQVRGSLGKLARQYWRYGFWKARTLAEHPRSLRWRQVVAPAFVASLLLTPWFVATVGIFGMAPVGLYLIADLTASALVARRRGPGLFPVLPVVFAVVHCSWGAGLLAGIVWWPLRNR
jgi:succinoglycan biosynthesis protein ExoA